MAYPGAMETVEPPQVWYRNAGYYIQQLANCEARLTSWDAGYLATRRKLQPIQMYCDLHFGVNTPWEAIVVDDYFSTHWKAGHKTQVGVYPTWSANSDSWGKLVDLIENPWGESARVLDVNIEPHTRPVRGQDHIVVITNLPSVGGPRLSHPFYEDLSEVQRRYPEVKLFIHGIYSFRFLFGQNYRMVDIESRTVASKGLVVLPSGGYVRPEQMDDQTYWLDMLGYRAKELTDTPGLRSEYNIRSAQWAARYYKSLAKIAPGGMMNKGKNRQAIEKYIRTNHITFTKRLAVRPGDKVVCDDCSLWLSCKLYREGAICAVAESDFRQISQLFGTRDSGDVVKGLTKLIEVNVTRAGRAADEEEADEHAKLNPELTKLMDQVFKQGMELLRIVDPSYRASPGKVQVNVNGAGARAEITGSDESRQLASNAIAALEARGIPRDQITEDMLKQFFMAQMGNGPIQIEGSTA